MARRRMLDPNFWQSEDVSKLSLFARLLLIGMISNADDSGRGRASPNYLKSVVFPYDEIPTEKVKGALEEIGDHISVALYEVEGSCYYQFLHWKKWQRVDKPQPSILPPWQGEEEETAGEQAAQTRAYRQKTPFVPPSLEEVKAYCQKRNSTVDPEEFFDYYTATGWKSGKNEVRDYKALVRQWERKKEPCGKPKNSGWDIGQHFYTPEEYDAMIHRL